MIYEIGDETLTTIYLANLGKTIEMKFLSPLHHETSLMDFHGSTKSTPPIAQLQGVRPSLIANLHLYDRLQINGYTS